MTAMNTWHLKFKVTPPKVATPEVLNDAHKLLSIIDSEWWIETAHYEGAVTLRRLLLLTEFIAQLRLQLEGSVPPANGRLALRTHVPVDYTSERAITVLSKLGFEPIKN